MDVETEIVEIKRRLTAVENEVKSEQQFSVRLFNYVREIRDDVAILRSHAMVTDGRTGRVEERMDRLEARMDRLEERMARLEQRLQRVEDDLGALRSEFNDFRREFPGMVAEAMREVLREHRMR